MPVVKEAGLPNSRLALRVIYLIFGILLVTLVGVRFYWQPATAPTAIRAVPALPVRLVGARSGSSASMAATSSRDSIVRFALQQVGTPYVYAGASPRTGFDCSGFLQYVYAHFGIDTPHATALLISAGQPVARAEARPGDIIVFTGTAEGSTTPGHAGIVISAVGETPLRFVHASSARRESGVKVSQLEGSGYERRFMQVRRVLSGSPNSAAPLAKNPRVALPAPAAPTKAVAALATKPAAVAAVPMAPLPAKVAPLPRRAWVAIRAGNAAARPTQHRVAKVVAKKKVIPGRLVRKAVTKKKAASKKPPTTAKAKK